MEKTELISLSEALPGMVIAQDVCGKNGVVLCNRGELLTEELRGQLSQLEVTEISVRNESGKNEQRPTRQHSLAGKGGFDPERHVDRCLSLILHHEEVQQIAVIVKNLLREKVKH